MVALNVHSAYVHVRDVQQTRKTLKMQQKSLFQKKNISITIKIHSLTKIHLQWVELKPELPPLSQSVIVFTIIQPKDLALE